MPALLTLRLAAVPGMVGPRQLLGAACGLFETDTSDHHAAVKPFAVGPFSPASTVAAPAQDTGSASGAAWRLGWLPDGPPPAWPPTQVRFGVVTCPVVAHHEQAWSFAEIAATPPARRAVLTVLTPLFFARNGRDLPLPEPVLIVRSLVTRWNAHAPAGLAISDTDSRAVADAVYLAAMPGGHTVDIQVADTVHQTGFVGTAELALLRAAANRTASILAALARFAVIAGIGAQTTHGFGAVDVQLPARPAGR